MSAQTSMTAAACFPALGLTTATSRGTTKALFPTAVSPIPSGLTAVASSMPSGDADVTLGWKEFSRRRSRRHKLWDEQANKRAAATFRIAAACFSCVSRKLLLLRVVHFLHRLGHVFVRLFHRIVFLLLLGREQRADLRAGAFHERPHFFHRFFMDGLELRFHLIEDRLDLGLLVRREAQTFAEMIEWIFHVMVRSGSVFMLGSVRILSLKISEAAQRESAGGDESDKLSCHWWICFLFSAQPMRLFHGWMTGPAAMRLQNSLQNFVRPSVRLIIL